MAQLTMLVAALLVIALFSFRPWAVTALREGFPSDTWPADGRFVTRGPIDQVAAVPANRLEATDRFRQELTRSDASAVVVMQGPRSCSATGSPSTVPTPCSTPIRWPRAWWAS